MTRKSTGTPRRRRRASRSGSPLRPGAPRWLADGDLASEQSAEERRRAGGERRVEVEAERAKLGPLAAAASPPAPRPPSATARCTARGAASPRRAPCPGRQLARPPSLPPRRTSHSCSARLKASAASNGTFCSRLTWSSASSRGSPGRATSESAISCPTASGLAGRCSWSSSAPSAVQPLAEPRRFPPRGTAPPWSRSSGKARPSTEPDASATSLMVSSTHGAAPEAAPGAVEDVLPAAAACPPGSGRAGDRSLQPPRQPGHDPVHPGAVRRGEPAGHAGFPAAEGRPARG